LGVARTVDWRERRNLRRAWRVHCFLPAIEDPHADPSFYYLVHLENTGSDLYRAVVSYAVFERRKHFGADQQRRRGMVGACRRFSSGYADRRDRTPVHPSPCFKLEQRSILSRRLNEVEVILWALLWGVDMPTLRVSVEPSVPTTIRVPHEDLGLRPH